MAAKNSPSYAHRNFLWERDKKNIPILMDSFPLNKYYDLNERLKEHFYKAEKSKRWDEAYCLGKRYMTISVNVIPKHPYYQSKAFVTRKRAQLEEAKKVENRLHFVIQMMDADALLREERAKTAELKRREEEEDRKFAAMVHRMEQNKLVDMGKAGPQSNNDSSVPSAPPAYDSVSPEIGKADDCAPPSLYPEPPAPSFSSITTPTAPSYAAHAPSAPSAPPSFETYNHSSSDYNNYDLNDPCEPSSPLYPKTYLAPIPMSQLKQVFSEEWRNTLDKTKNADVFALETHQGKVRDRNGLDSTNGCTVIAPLIATTHVRSSGGVSDDAIAQIIDNIAPQLLHVIRAKLGLGPNSLIIPSDVHDHLFDKKIISPESFVGVSGGNVMSDEHIGNMLDCLNDDGGGKGQRKTACAFFFHAHVVCIVKLVVNGGKDIWYDLIDSLPHLVGNVNEGTRTRCKDVESLRTHLRWYASSKFGPADCDYIDRNEWNNDRADFDPRVFQAFTWAEKFA